MSKKFVALARVSSREQEREGYCVTHKVLRQNAFSMQSKSALRKCNSVHCLRNAQGRRRDKMSVTLVRNRELQVARRSRPELLAEHGNEGARAAVA